MHEQDRQLIKRLVLGDSYAELQFVHRWHPRIIGWIRQQAPSVEARDYAQEVLIHLARDNWDHLLKWRGLYEDTPNLNSLAGFLRRVTRNKTIDLLRADGHELAEEDEPAEIEDKHSPMGVNPSDQVEDAAKRALLERLIAELPPRDRNLLTMWRLGHPDSHTALMLRMEPNNVRQRRKYLIDKIRARFREERGGGNGNE